jgi:ketosteroid isomerase-like protein
MSPGDAVLAAEAARADAVIRRDRPALEALLHESLVYIHATGVRHDRAEWLSYVQEGPRFHAVTLESPTVRVADRVALVDGLLRLHLQRGREEPVHAVSRVTQTWLLRDGAWRLASQQSTRALDVS